MNTISLKICITLMLHPLCPNKLPNAPQQALNQHKSTRTRPLPNFNQL